MSPEERAKAICARITTFADWRDREALIAQAIRDAEGAAYERIAGVIAEARDELASQPKGNAGELDEAVWSDLMGIVIEFANACIEEARSLKSKEI